MSYGGPNGNGASGDASSSLPVSGVAPFSGVGILRRGRRALVLVAGCGGSGSLVGGDVFPSLSPPVAVATTRSPLTPTRSHAREAPTSATRFLPASHEERVSNFGSENLIWLHNSQSLD
uniref:Uncharacterized protein n=1 Tax=Oryza punctata TaxID=4537 RepID=A0A0E0KB24_ORYPU